MRQNQPRFVKLPEQILPFPCQELETTCLEWFDQCDLVNNGGQLGNAGISEETSTLSLAIFFSEMCDCLR